MGGGNLPFAAWKRCAPLVQALMLRRVQHMQILTGSTKWGNLLKEERINVRRLGGWGSEKDRIREMCRGSTLMLCLFFSVSLSHSFLASALITEHQESKEQLIHQCTTLGLLLRIQKWLSKVNTDWHKMTIKNAHCLQHQH